MLGFFNRLMDGWSVMADKVFTNSINRYPLTLIQNKYSIGPSGADITAPRPVRIDNANLILTSQSPEVYIPLRILDDNEFADLAVQNYATQIPTMLYYNKRDEGSELGDIYLIGKPSQANDLQLFTSSKFTNSMLIGDSITLPEGYLDAVVLTLTVRIAPLYWQRSNGALAEVKDQARRARAALVPLNTQAPHQQSDAPMGSGESKGPYFSYLTGLPG